ncbi:11097_t:CDS:2 [Ambispora gerdemannii]|uniref:11097_t:CDS:1 n=1 Tax=Ambispora gerdemannii TaxID=144530 RepID=A0A9N9BLQ8_9GLOM|nr:11097_t:CDS:2 [Ambispora gerdemannii]
MLEGISNDSKASQEVRARAKKLLQKKEGLCTSHRLRLDKSGLCFSVNSSWLRPDYLHPLLTTP